MQPQVLIASFAFAMSLSVYCYKGSNCDLFDHLFLGLFTPHTYNNIPTAVKVLKYQNVNTYSKIPVWCHFIHTVVVALSTGKKKICPLFGG